MLLFDPILSDLEFHACLFAPACPVSFDRCRVPFRLYTIPLNNFMNRSGNHMRDEALEESAKLNMAAQKAGRGWADQWLDHCLNALFAAMVLGSLIGLVYVLSRP
jgi:hypothetical protein